MLNTRLGGKQGRSGRLWRKHLASAGIRTLERLAQAVSGRLVAAKVQARSWATPCEIFSPSTSFYLASIIAEVLHAHLHLPVALTTRAKDRSLRAFKRVKH